MLKIINTGTKISEHHESRAHGLNILVYCLQDEEEQVLEEGKSIPLNSNLLSMWSLATLNTLDLSLLTKDEKIYCVHWLWKHMEKYSR